jgi:beta-N-acetylhexosaminidase
MVGRSPSASLLARIEAGEVGGVVLFARNIGTNAAVAALTERLQRAAAAGGNPPLLIAVDQEGGPVKRFADGPPDRAPADFATVAEAESEAAATGRFLAGLGVNLDLAPVLDTPSSGSSFLRRRAFGSEPGRNATLGRAFVRGLQRQRVAATAKHFPGLGTARQTTDRRAVVVAASRRVLDENLLPFRAAVRDGVKVVMVSGASYPAYDASRTPASLSRPIVTTLLREGLGFDGVVITDAMEAPATAGRSDSATRAIAAGVDLLLYTSEATSRRGFAELLAAARAAELPRSELERAYGHVTSLKRWLGRG